MRLTLCLALAIPLVAADTEIRGHLLDSDCAHGEVKTAAFAARHSRACLQMRECGRSGYGVLTADNKYIRFDLVGSETARKFLDGVAKTTDIRVVVTGTVNGDKMTVQKIELQ